MSDLKSLAQSRPGEWANNGLLSYFTPRGRGLKRERPSVETVEKPAEEDFLRGFEQFAQFRPAFVAGDDSMPRYKPYDYEQLMMIPVSADV